MELLIYTFIAILGLTLGSFLNVVIYRLPIMMFRQWRAECSETFDVDLKPDHSLPDVNLCNPPSQCPHCHTPIKFYHNIPVISFLLLKGRCAHCQTAISWRYPIIELVTAILSLMVIWQVGFNLQGMAVLVFTWFLIAMTVIDIDHQLIPDSLSLSLLWLGLALNAFWFFVSPTDAIIGALAGYLSLWSFVHLFKIITGKQGMGHGDFKLFAAFGAWLGWQPLLLIILLSSFVGAIVGIGSILFKFTERGAPIPFGPFLAIAGWISMLWGNQIINWYLY